MASTFADGQLAASTGTILGAGSAERNVMVTLHNTGSGDQLVTLTLSRAGGTARVIFRDTLGDRQTAYVVGLPMDPSDVLAGYAATADTIDYVVAASTGQFAVLGTALGALFTDMRNSLWKIQ